MPNDEDSLTGIFEELLSLLEHALSVEQIRDLQALIDYEEHELAFEVLVAMLRQAGAKVPQEPSAFFLRLAHQLRIDAARWQDVCEPPASE